jgi:hypothetical protein
MHQPFVIASTARAGAVLCSPQIIQQRFGVVESLDAFLGTGCEQQAILDKVISDLMSAVTEDVRPSSKICH